MDAHVREVNQRYARILVVRALQLGDLLCAVPALRALRAWQPHAHITLCGLPWASEFARRFSTYVDAFLEFPGYEGLPERPADPQKLAACVATARQHPYDLVVQLHGSGPYINDFVRELGAHRSAGFHPQNNRRLALDASLAWPERGHELERLKALVVHLGAPDCGNHLEFPIQPAEFSAATRLLEAHGIDAAKPYVCVHSGGRSLTRRWPIDRFAAVARQLAADGWPIVLTGANAEADVASALEFALQGRCVNLAGKTTLGEIAAVLDRARLLLSNDTGVSHIAAARGTPSVILVLGSDPDRWFPQDDTLHFQVSVPVDCRPCSHRLCPIGFRCALELLPEQVTAAARYALQQTESVCA